MFADGGAAFMSIKLGEKEDETAARGVGCTITMAAIAAMMGFVIDDSLSI